MTRLVHALIPHTKDVKSIIENAKEKIGHVIHVAVYDAFEGDVKILSSKDELVFVEIVKIERFFTPYESYSAGDRLWIEDWNIS